jgi:hypothetical protein
MIAIPGRADITEEAMLTILKIPDSDAHEPGCMEANNGIECDDPNLTYLDIFCECHRYTTPKILGNGTDIAWPAGWTQEQATQWRAGNGHLPPTTDCTADVEADALKQ